MTLKVRAMHQWRRHLWLGNAIAFELRIPNCEYFGKSV